MVGVEYLKRQRTFLQQLRFFWLNSDSNMLRPSYPHWHVEFSNKSSSGLYIHQGLTGRSGGKFTRSDLVPSRKTFFFRGVTEMPPEVFIVPILNYQILPVDISFK